jgi:hypothetical protein
LIFVLAFISLTPFLGCPQVLDGEAGKEITHLRARVFWHRLPAAGADWSSLLAYVEQLDL